MATYVGTMAAISATTAATVTAVMGGNGAQIKQAFVLGLERGAINGSLNLFVQGALGFCKNEVGQKPGANKFPGPLTKAATWVFHGSSRFEEGERISNMSYGGLGGWAAAPYSSLHDAGDRFFGMYQTNYFDTGTACLDVGGQIESVNTVLSTARATMLDAWNYASLLGTEMAMHHAFTTIGDKLGHRLEASGQNKMGQAVSGSLSTPFGLVGLYETVDGIVKR